MQRFPRFQVLALIALTTPSCLSVDTGGEEHDSSTKAVLGPETRHGQVYRSSEAKRSQQRASEERASLQPGRVVEFNDKGSKPANGLADVNRADAAPSALAQTQLADVGRVVESNEKELARSGKADFIDNDERQSSLTLAGKAAPHALTGGPDAQGYTFIDSNEAGGPGFFWVDISSTGTQMNLSDDSHFYPITLPFNFNFYGTDYSNLAVGSNGTVYFDNQYLGLANTPIPGSNAYGVDRFIAVYWDDLDPGAGGAVYYQVRGNAPNRRLIVQWNDVRHFAGTDTVTVQAILFEGSNNVLLQYLDPSGEAGSEATVGIQSSATVGLQYLYNAAALAAQSAVCFVPPGGSSAGCKLRGPDAGGYTFTDSNQPGSPAFFWQDISTTGAQVNLSDDSYFYPVALPFTFNFYGAGYSNITIGSNGIVYFDNQFISYINTPIPSSTGYGVERFIAAYWDDLNPSAGGAVYYQIRGSAPNRRLIIQWEDVPHYASADKVTVQAILFEGTGNILMQYLNPSLEAGAEATVGIQNSPTVGLQYHANEAVLSPGLAICYVPPGGSSAGCRVNGPDAGGYTFTDSHQAGSPQFYWQEISATGTPMFLSDDSHFYPIALPFTFNFYGVGYSNIAVGSNGTVYFDNQYLGLLNTPIPGPSNYGVNRFIAAYWDDLNPGAGGGVYYQIDGSAPNRRLIVEWKDVPHYGSVDTVTVQAILFEGTGNILVQYLNPSSEVGSQAAVGIQNAANVGLQYSFHESVLSERLAICFSPPGGISTGCSMANWLSRKGTGSAAEGQEYYAAIGAPSTFAQWKSIYGFGFGGEVNAKYYNDFDLGLGRDMNCRKSGADLACYVTNYGIAPGGPAQAAINNVITTTNPIATVAMVYVNAANGGANDVRFYVYDKNGYLIPQVALDSEGPKSVPHVCLPCHGGYYDAGANAVHGASFLPFDVFSYIFSDVQGTYSLSSQQEAFRQLNAMVRDTSPNQPIINLIDGTYPGGVYNPGSTAQNTYVPPGWAGQEALYHNVVKTSCRGCHVAQSFDLTDVSHMGAAQYPVCISHEMPHAEKPFKNFWTSEGPHLPSYLASAMGWAACKP